MLTFLGRKFRSEFGSQGKQKDAKGCKGCGAGGGGEGGGGSRTAAIRTT